MKTKTTESPSTNWIFILILLFLPSVSAFSQTIDAVTPSSGWQGQSLGISISGTSLDFVQGTATVVWLEQNASVYSSEAYSVQNAEVLANIYISGSAPIGLYDVHIGENGVSGVSLPNGFEVLTALPLLPPPALLLPSNTADITANPIDFSWSSVPEASSYQYQVSSSPIFQGVQAQGVVTSTGFTSSFMNNQYYWRVRTKNAAGIYGNWSTTYEFTVTTQTSLNTVTPNSGYQGQVVPVTISGTNVSFFAGTPTSQFVFEMGLNSMPLDAQCQNQFNAPNFDFTGQGDLAIPIAIPTGIYDLRYTDPTNAAYYLPQVFTVNPALPAPGLVTLIEPINSEALNVAAVQFDWSDLANVDRYHIQISLTSDFVSPIVSVSGVSQSEYLRNLYDGMYYWRVRAQNLSGLWGSWSVIEDFVVDGTSHVTNMAPPTGYAGQNNMGVTVSGVNLPFFAGTSVVGSLRLNQNSYQIDLSNEQLVSTSSGAGILDIPLNAPVGYYQLTWELTPYAPVALQNAFYVTEGNEYSGRVYVDQNQNQVFDGGDVEYPYAQIQVSPSPSNAIAQSTGEYVGYVPSGTNSLSLGSLNYYTSTPSQHTVTFVGSGGVDAGNDFVLQPIAGMHDMTISLAAQQLRQGRDRFVYITITNVGAEVESGDFSLTFPAGMTVTSSSDPNYTLTGNTISWNFTLGILQEYQVDLELFTPGSFQVGQQVDFSAQVSDPSNDQTPSDNTFLLLNQVVASYDPNYKQVSPEGPIDQEFVSAGEFLNYTVHFQNTGNAEAIDVYVLDTISEFLDLNTFQFIIASHDRVVNLLNDRIVEFRFDNINLPDSTSNEPESHGYFTYRIKPVSSFAQNDVIANTAYIYFDFNEPIVTNTTENWIPVGVEDPKDGLWFEVQPNPNADGIFNVLCKEKVEYLVLDIQGAVVASGSLTNGSQLNLSSSSVGVYLLKVEGESGSTVKKLVKY